MDFLSTAIDAVLRAYFAAFSMAPPAVGLTVLAVLAGIGMLWIASKTSNQVSIKQVKRRVAASLLELRVFDDEPAVTGRALKSLMAANARYIGLALRPAVVMAIPMVLLLMHLESFCSTFSRSSCSGPGRPYPFPKSRRVSWSRPRMIDWMFDWNRLRVA